MRCLPEHKKLAEVPLDCHIEERVVHSGDDPHTALERQESLHLLDHRLAALPVDQRECLILREVEELSYKEIAVVTGVATGTVMSRLWRARRALLEMPQ